MKTPNKSEKALLIVGAAGSALFAASSAMTVDANDPSASTKQALYWGLAAVNVLGIAALLGFSFFTPKG